MIYRGRGKDINASPIWLGMEGCPCWSSTWCLAQAHETWLDLLTSAESFHLGSSLFLKNLDKASLVALHHVPATEIIRLNTFAQNITKRTVGSHLNNSSSASALCIASPTCTETCWSQDVANKGRSQLSIHFPRHLMLPIPFLLFSTPLILRTHCRCFYFVCFEIFVTKEQTRSCRFFL